MKIYLLSSPSISWAWIVDRRHGHKLRPLVNTAFVDSSACTGDEIEMSGIFGPTIKNLRQKFRSNQNFSMMFMSRWRLALWIPSYRLEHMCDLERGFACTTGIFVT